MKIVTTGEDPTPDADDDHVDDEDSESIPERPVPDEVIPNSPDTTVDIRPGVGAINAYRFMATTEWYALAELVDNSISSWLTTREFLADPNTGKSPLTIAIRFDPVDGGRIRVWDNAGGINAQDFKRAFKPGAAPENKDGLSRYGLGMKMAAIWFADNWKVVSTAFNEEFTRTVEFDVQKIIENEQQRIIPEIKPRGRANHGTEITLWNLRRIPKGSTLGKMKTYLATMYRGFIRSGDVEILWNDELLEYEAPAVLVAPRHTEMTDGDPLQWSKNFEIPIEGHAPVKGRAILFAKGKQAEAGLNLFWRGRLIKGNFEPNYKPTAIFPLGTFITQRLQVELHLDEFQPTFDKSNFAWHSCPLTEEELLARLKDALRTEPLDMLDQAQNFRSGEIDDASRSAAKEAASATANVIERKGADAIEERVASTAPANDELAEPGRQKFAHTEAIDISVAGRPWHITVQLSDRAQDTSDWLDITDQPSNKTGDDTRRLGIRIALNNPFTVRYGTNRNAMDILIRMATGIAIAEITAREASDGSPGAIRRNLNALLYDVLSEA